MRLDLFVCIYEQTKRYDVDVRKKFMYALHTKWCSVAQPIISNLLFFSFPLENVSYIPLTRTHKLTHSHSSCQSHPEIVWPSFVHYAVCFYAICFVNMRSFSSIPSSTHTLSLFLSSFAGLFSALQISFRAVYSAHVNIDYTVG